ncbi:unnamed protein product [Trichobilharzia regenti]|nr:unnamed protein product [Trichobilharzia regenti]
MMRRYSQNQRSKSPDDELRDAFNVSCDDVDYPLQNRNHF